eukprot:GSChrysophyteH1.ASY1.ANO1.2943.1 assembled CDS
MDTKLHELRVEATAIQSLGWHHLYRSDVLEVLHRAVETHVKVSCKEDFETPMLPELQRWLQEALLPFALSILSTEADAEAEAYDHDKQRKPGHNKVDSDHLWSSLSHCLLRSLSLLRASELFDLVVEFPDSLCAAREFKEAAAASNSIGAVGKIFCETVRRRLLHSGAGTAQIIDFYINMIRALRVIDSSDLLLNYVGSPIRKYLRRRKDTVRCVVSTLLQGRSSELHSELRKGSSLEYGPDEDDEDKGPGLQWQPRRRDPDLADVTSEASGLDVLALLISIYGSTDLFVKDYRALLADQLLQNLEYRADGDMATLELLKIRFGEPALHTCEVMLRDLEESRRINGAVLKERKSDADLGVVDMMVLSEHYWPPLPTEEDSLTLAPTAHASVQRYLDIFKQVKKPRHLVLAPQLGSVELQLDFDDGSVRHFTVSTAQASTVLFIAGDGQKWASSDGCLSLTELANLLGVQEAEAHRYAAFWVNRGVVRQRSLTAQAATRRDEEQAEFHDENYASGSVLAAAAAAAEKAAVSTYESYIKGILSSHGQMEIGRLHTMLKLVMGEDSGSGTKFDMTFISFQRFLQGLIERDVLEASDGVYRVRKATG